MRLHTEGWLDHVRKVVDEVAGLPCGHWVMEDASFIEILSRWLEKTREA